MKFSMNGFRRQLSNDVATLSEIITTVLNSDYYDDEDLIEAMNQVITHSNVVNCAYNNDDPDFSDMSDLEIDHIVEQNA